MIEKIENNGELIAIIIYRDYHNDGVSFITNKESLLQIGYMSHPEGYEVKPHIHRPVNRHTVGTQEVLIIKSGTVKVNLYTHSKAYLESRVLTSGDMILLAGAGHGIAILEDATLIEIKNGPYIENSDKDRFE